MADVKWIRIVTDVFDDEKIKLIESLPDHDTIIVIWFKVLCLAGKSNKNGYLMMSDKIHYTDDMLVSLFNRPKNTVKLALETFANFGMIEIDDGIRISNWDKHQNIDGLDKIREQNRIRQERFRAKALQLNKNNVIGNVTVTESNAIDIDKELEKDKDKDKDIKDNLKDILSTSVDVVDKKQPINYQYIQEQYNFICVDLPKCQKLSEARKRSIKTFLNEYSLDELITVFEKAQQSSFLRNGQGTWKGATFDWLLNKANALKVIEGNYDNNGQQKTGNKQMDALKEFYQQAKEMGIE